MGELKTIKLEDEIRLIYGKGLIKNTRVEGEFNVYGSNGVVGTHNEAIFKGPGLIIGRKGTVGSVVLSRDDFYAIDTTYVLELNDPNDDLMFWYYYLKTLGLDQMNSHSAVPGLSRDAVYRKEVNILTDINERKRVAATLSCLDDKIELNNRMNKNLEEMAQAIFKSWFVDFEPFQGGEFEESELGMIPKGWRVGTLSDLGNVVGGSTPSKAKPEYYTTDGIPWITPKDLSNNKDKYIYKGEIDITELGLKSSSTTLLPKGSILFSSRAPIGYIAIAMNNVTTNQGFKSIIPKINVGSSYVFLYLKNIIELIESRATGSTFKEVSGAIMKSIPALLPSEEVLLSFQEQCNKFFEMQILIESENRKLIETRDTLLPKLMSGEIRVPIEEVQ